MAYGDAGKILNFYRSGDAAVAEHSEAGGGYISIEGVVVRDLKMMTLSALKRVYSSDSEYTEVKGYY